MARARLPPAPTRSPLSAHRLPLPARAQARLRPPHPTQQTAAVRARQQRCRLRQPPSSTTKTSVASTSACSTRFSPNSATTLSSTSNPSSLLCCPSTKTTGQNRKQSTNPPKSRRRHPQNRLQHQTRKQSLRRLYPLHLRRSRLQVNRSRQPLPQNLSKGASSSIPLLHRQARRKRALSPSHLQHRHQRRQQASLPLSTC